MVGMAPVPNSAPIPICVRDSVASPSGPAQEPVPDPITKRTDAAMAQIQSMKQLLDSRNALDDPRIQRLKAGYWNVFQANPSAKPGQNCTAMFMNANGIISVLSQGGLTDPALLVFSGPNVPMPRQGGPVDVVLHQTRGGATRTKAYSYTQPGSGVGSVAFGLTSLQSGIDGIMDHGDFRIELGGRNVIDMSMHGGSEAKRQLAQCAARR